MKKKLTAVMLERLSTSLDREDIWDTLVPGLLIILRGSGRKTWSVRYRVDGMRVTQKIGVFPAMGLQAARDKARTILALVAQGENPAFQEKQVRDGKQAKRIDTSRQIAPLLCDYGALRLSQLRTGNQAITFLREFREQYGRYEIDDFTRQDFVRLTNSIVKQGHGTKANRVHTHIKTFFNWAIGQAIIQSNPCDRVPKPYKERTKTRFLSSEEISWFWFATGQDLEPFGYLARFLLLTGQRLNECAKMTEPELIGTDHWHLSSIRTKNRNIHDVFLSVQAQSIVERKGRIKGPNGYIFSTTGYSPVQSFDKPVKRLRLRMNECAGRELEHFTFHDLRRTCETGLAMLGTPQPVIDRITNHLTGRGMARVYNMHDYRAEKAQAMQRWADAVEGIVS